jgi:hypothetical protein
VLRSWFLSDAGTLPVQDQYVIDGQRDEASRPAIGVEKFDFDAIRRKKFNNRPNVAHFDVRFGRRIQHSHDVQQVWFSRSGHVTTPQLLYYKASYQARHVLPGADDPRRTNRRRPHGTVKFEVNYVSLSEPISFSVYGMSVSGGVP